MRAKGRPRETWQRWTIWLPGTLAFAASGLLIGADGIAGVMGSWDTPEPGLGWIKVAITGTAPWLPPLPSQWEPERCAPPGADRPR
ncbi:MAG: hypothetical protein ACLPUO_17725 [Streptosporangiaceae bacterium]|jgi:hypothetical protein